MIKREPGIPTSFRLPKPLDDDIKTYMRHVPQKFDFPASKTSVIILCIEIAMPDLLKDATWWAANEINEEQS